MSSSTSSATSTRDVALSWFNAISKGDIETAMTLLDSDVEFINYTPVPGYNTDMPWIGTHKGAKAVLDSFKVFVDTCEVMSEDLMMLITEGDEAIGIVHEISLVKANRECFEIEFIQHLTIRNGRITRWKSYTDPSPIIRALRADSDDAG
jgi:uncharacterized protein